MSVSKCAQLRGISGVANCRNQKIRRFKGNHNNFLMLHLVKSFLETSKELRQVIDFSRQLNRERISSPPSSHKKAKIE